MSKRATLPASVLREVARIKNGEPCCNGSVLLELTPQEFADLRARLAVTPGWNPTTGKATRVKSSLDRKIEAAAQTVRVPF